MKKGLLIALCLLMLCATAQAATVTETGTGVSVVKAADWAQTYPDVYASYLKNAENDTAMDHVEEYPMIATVYEGMAFNKYYGSATGSLRAGKKVAIFATHGYERDYAVEPFEMDIASFRTA